MLWQSIIKKPIISNRMYVLTYEAMVYNYIYEVIEMSLRLIYGCAGSGKSKFCMNSMKSKIESDFEGALILIVPEQFSFQAEKNLMKAVGEKGLLKAQVLSFKRLAYRVFNEAGGITRKRMDSTGKSMLLYTIIDELKDDLKVYKKSGRQQGFVDTVADAITEFKRYNVPPSVLEHVISEVEEESLKQKLEDIELIYNRFEELIKDKYIDSDDDLTFLAEKLSASDIYNGAEIWFDEFSTFTPQQYEIIKMLLKKVKRVNITLCANCSDGEDTENTDIFATIKNTERKLLKLCAENNIGFDEPVDLSKNRGYRFKQSPSLSHLEKHFFSYPYKVYKNEVDDISIFKAMNMYTEVEKLARSIVNISREKGIRYNKIAVITRDLKDYAKLIQVIFNEYDIPYFLDQKRDINKNSLLIFLNSAIEILTKNWSYEAVFRYLKTGLTDVSREEIDILENYVLANGIKGKAWLKGNWSYSASSIYSFRREEENDEELLKRINDIREKAVTPLVEFYEEIRNLNKVRDICETIYKFLCKVNIPDKIEKWVENFKTQGLNALASEYSQAFNTVIELLEQLVEVMGEEHIKPDKLVKIIQTGINRCKVGIIPSALDQVLVGDIERVKSHEVDYVFIIGVNDGVFPKVPEEEGILSDVDREYLKSHGVELAQDTRSLIFEEQYLMYKALTISGKKLYISYPIADFEGKTLRPSIIISKLKKIFPKINISSDIIRSDSDEESLEYITNSKATFNQLISVMRADFEGIKANPIWWDVLRWYDKNEYWKDKCYKAFCGLTYTNQIKFINSESIKKLYGNPLYLSASKLQRYVECPFSFYLQYGLKAQDRKGYEFSLPDAGSFMHEILLDFSTALDKEKMSWRDVDRKWCEDAISIIVDKKAEDKGDFILNSSERYKYFQERYKRILSRAVWTVAQHIKGSGFTPSFYETSFGEKKDGMPAITINLPSGDVVHFTGRIDRIDTYETEQGTYIRVIDYKSGDSKFKLSDVYYGLKLQLLLYLDVILSNADKYIEGETMPGAMLYFKIDDPIVKVDSEIDEAEIENQITKQLKMDGIIIDDIKIIKEMDKDICGASLYIPAMLKKDGSFGSSSSTAKLEQFELLREYARDTLIDLCEDMLKGNVAISPYKKGKATSCNYCSYSSICGFDTSFQDNKYRYFTDKSNDEIWELMKSKVEGEDK